MKVEQACRLSADGIAKTKESIRTEDGNILEISLYAKFNEIQGKYTVTQYFNRQKIETSNHFQDPHQSDRWRPSKRFSSEGPKKHQTKSKFCLYMLISKEKYRFKVGITHNIYTKIYQLRSIWGEFDLGTSYIVYGNEKHLQKLESIMHFVFEDYHLGCSLSDNKNWFDLDCIWYVKNEIRRLNSFREEKIFRIYEGIDLNAFIVEDSNLLAKGVDIDVRT